jgi:predicted nucleotide-binding protein (sugar kinase/HSP70/actin superfamily)
MLKATFPHIGNSYIPFRTLLTELGLEPVVPPPVSGKTVELGSKIAPEFACFPLKVNLGNYLEAIEAGAEVILMAGGVGPCRFGYYGEVQREILQEAGYSLDFFLLEAPKTHPTELWRQIVKLFPRHRLNDLWRAIHLAWLKAEALDRFDRLVNRIRPVENIPGSTTQLQRAFYHKVDQAVLEREIRMTADQGIAELSALPVRAREAPLRIMLVGEIYMVLEPHVNFEIERLLGEMGAEVHRTIYFTDWFLEQICLSIINPGWRKRLQLMARPYLRNFIGGHGIETVAHTVEAGVNRFDGVVQLAPFTCMPEIVAMQVLPAVSRDLSIPLLTVIIDEHSAEVGVRTRLEAFIDLLSRKKKQNGGGVVLEIISRN